MIPYQQPLCLATHPFPPLHHSYLLWFSLQANQKKVTREPILERERGCGREVEATTRQMNGHM